MPRWLPTLHRHDVYRAPTLKRRLLHIEQPVENRLQLVLYSLFRRCEHSALRQFSAPLNKQLHFYLKSILRRGHG
jgi:hypothetical protein